MPTETTDIDPDAPIAWRVSAMKPQDRITGHKPEVVESQSASRAAAEEYKRDLQAQGYVASVTPIFLTPQARGKIRAKTQMRTVPPKYNKDWRLYGDSPKPVGE